MTSLGPLPELSQNLARTPAELSHNSLRHPTELSQASLTGLRPDLFLYDLIQIPMG